MAGLGYCSFGVQTQYAEGSSSGLSTKLLFWSTNSARGTLFQWQGLETALLEYKLSTQNALPVAGLGNCFFGSLFWSTNSVRRTLFQWQGLETALLEYKLSTQNALPLTGPCETAPFACKVGTRNDLRVAGPCDSAILEY